MGGGKGGFGYINLNNLSGGIVNKNSKKNLKEGNIFLFTKDIKEKMKKSKMGNKNWLNKKHNQKSKDKIGKANSILQKGTKNSQYGTCWITNGIINKKIKKEDIDNWVNIGYSKGRVL